MPWLVVMDNCSSNVKLSSNNTFMKPLVLNCLMMTKDYLTYNGPPKLHESPVKHHFIPGSCKCSTKQLSSLLTKILSYRDWTRKYITIKTSHTGVNNIELWGYGF